MRLQGRVWDAHGVLVCPVAVGLCVGCRTYLWRNVVSLGVLMLLLVAMAHVPETDPTLMLFLTALTGTQTLQAIGLPHIYIYMAYIWPWKKEARWKGSGPFIPTPMRPFLTVEPPNLSSDERCRCLQLARARHGVHAGVHVPALLARLAADRLPHARALHPRHGASAHLSRRPYSSRSELTQGREERIPSLL